MDWAVIAAGDVGEWGIIGFISCNGRVLDVAVGRLGIPVTENKESSAGASRSSGSLFIAALSRGFSSYGVERAELPPADEPGERALSGPSRWPCRSSGMIKARFS
jgi:hypothetical protein